MPAKKRDVRRDTCKKTSGKPNKNDKTYKGSLSVTPSGLGFLTPDDGSSDIFIPPRYLGSAMDKDLVEVKILDDDFRGGDNMKGPAGKITAIIERARNSVVGEMLEGYRVRPLNKKIPNDIKLSGSPGGAKKGEWVEVSLIHSDRNKHTEELKGKITGSLGKAGTIKADIRAIISEYNLPEPYTDEQNEEAAKLKALDINREDLTKLFCVTIDPVDAKDFDDAISISKVPGRNEIMLGVHISDVAAWVQPNTKWDKSARKRAFTAYLPGKTMPMLPKTITAAISLTPDKDSLAHTIMMTVDSETGRILNSRRFHSKIRVTKRLTFEQVQAFIDGKEHKDWDKDFCANMKEVVKLALNLRKYRKEKEDFLELVTTEIRAVCDEENEKILGLKKETQTQADELVEDCMLAANSEAAKELITRSIPGLFRIHPEPPPEKLEEFSAFAAGTFNISTGDLNNRSNCNRFLKKLPDDHKKPVIINAFLRSLPRACYTEFPELHFGLGKTRYCHFTSPIRRYPDLIVHQQFWAADTNTRLRSKLMTTEIAEECSKKEINNDEAYYAANDRMKLQYLKMHSETPEEKVYEAVITRISSSGLSVDVADLGIYGFVPSQFLGPTRYQKKDKKLKAAARSHQNYKCGDFIFLHLDRIDFIKGSAIFRPVV